MDDYSGPPFTSRVYQHDRLTDVTTLVSRSHAGPTTGVNADVTFFSTSEDGSLITYTTAATDVIADFVNGNGDGSDVYLFDRQTGQAQLVTRSATLPLAGANGGSALIGISNDGETLAFSSTATDLIGGGNGKAQVYLYSRTKQSVSLVSYQASQPTQPASAGIDGARLSRDGRYVAMSSRSPDLVAGYVAGTNAKGVTYDTYVHDGVTGLTRLASGSGGSATNGSNGWTTAYAVASDGSVVIQSDATDLLNGMIDGNKASDVFHYDSATGTVSAVSAAAAKTISADGESRPGSRDLLSADGRYYVFESFASNLATGVADANNVADIFLFDSHTNQTTLVSHRAGMPGVAANAASKQPVISGDGRYVAYVSYATDIIADFVDGNGGGSSAHDLYLYDRVTGQTTLVSRSTAGPHLGGDQGSGWAYSTSATRSLALSGDGRYVAYMSLAADLVPGFVDGNAKLGLHADLFLFDRKTGTNSLISHAAGQPNRSGNRGGLDLGISADGQFIAFVSDASDLLPNVTGGRDLYLHEVATGTTTLVSRSAAAANVPGNGVTFGLQISADGRTIAFGSTASNLVAGGVDGNQTYDVFVYDHLTGVTELISRSIQSPTQAGNSYSEWSAMSADGRYVLYTSFATDLVAGFVDNNGTHPFALAGLDTYLHDRVTGVTTLVSRRAGTAADGGNGHSLWPVMSRDGRYVVLTSDSSDLTDPQFNDPWPGYQIYQYDRVTNQMELITAVPGAASIPFANGDSDWPVVSADGTVVAFRSSADNLIANDYNAAADLFLYVNSAPRVLNLQLNDGSPQRSTVRSLTVTLDQPVTFTGDPSTAFTLTHAKTGTAVTLNASISYDTRTVVTLTFAGPSTEFGSLADGDYTLTIHATKVTGHGPLDGNGDGIGGDNYLSQPGTIFRLFGDATGDRNVNFADFLLLRTALFTSSVDNPFDHDNDGDVDFLDFLQFRSRFGTSI